MYSLKRILIVDDEPGSLFVLGAALARLAGPPEVVTAPDGRAAWDMVRQEPFDLVITDLKMPGMGGVELTRAIRSARQDLPVIWITAHGNGGLEDDAAGLNVYCCLHKPVTLAEIRRIVREALDWWPDAAAT
jgi:CheY-like chemotaxis protein